MRPGRTTYASGVSSSGQVLSVKTYGATGDGVTDDYAAIQAAIDTASTSQGIVFLPPGVYNISEELTIDATVELRGAGMHLTTITGDFESAYLLHKSSDTTRSGITLSDMTFDAQNEGSCFRAQYVDDLIVSRCRFMNIAIWGAVVGVLDAEDDTIRNSRVTFEQCVFDTNASTYEQLLLFNSQQVKILNCHFRNISTNANGVGLYQLIDDVLIDGCTWKSSVGRALFYSLSCNNIKIVNNNIESGDGIQGGNLSDNGTFDADAIRDLVIANNTIRTLASGTGCQVGAVNGGSVIGNTFYRCHEIALLVNRGNNGINIMPKDITIQGNKFIENNQVGNVHIYHPGIFVQVNSSDAIGLTIAGNVFTDYQGTSTQRYPIVFVGTGAMSGVAIIGNSLYAPSGSSVAFDTATQGSDFVNTGNVQVT